MNGVPELKYSLYADYSFAALSGEFTLHADYVWEDDTTGAFGTAQIEQWDTLNLSVAYIGLDDAPVSTPEIPGFGSLEGEFESRDTLLFQVGLSWGDL